MKMTNNYLLPAFRQSAKSRFSGFAMLFLSILLLGSAARAFATSAPLFSGPNPATITACQGANPINALLAVSDPDAADVLTWSQNTAPSQGSLVFGGTELATGGTVTPSGISYTPVPGYYGADSFKVDVSDGTNTITMTVYVTVGQTPIISVSNAAVCFGATTAGINYSTASTFSFSGAVEGYVVPEGVTSLNFNLIGAGGGRDTSAGAIPGKGGRVEGALSVTPGDVFTVRVGGAGSIGTSSGAAGGYNGGGISFGYGGSGGGATDIRFGGSALTDRIIVAGGGAGSGASDMGVTVAGGDGGNTTGADGAVNADGGFAGAGTDIAGGLGATYTAFFPGVTGLFGFGGDGSADGISGGGGAGYYGGGGGAWSGGGGGSSFTHPTAVTSFTHIPGVSAGNGQAVLSYAVPASYTYSINWDAPAVAAGFTNVAASSFPTSSFFPVTIPATATPAIYNGTLIISNGLCTQTESISVNVKPIPDVNATTDVTYCTGVPTSAITFSGSLPSTNYNWTNNSTSIGLGASGANSIGSFITANSTSSTTVAEIIVTPELNGCFGTSDTFTISVFPTPTLSSDVNVNICNNSLFSYTATGAVTGTTFDWVRNVVAGIDAPAASGSTGIISETLDNTTDNTLNAVYSFTLTANGCTSTQAVTVAVNPTPVLFPTPLVGTICSGDNFTFTQSSMTTLATYSWSRAAVAGIAEPATSGVGNIDEVLTNTTANPITVTYIDTLHINGCTNTQTLEVVVNPLPILVGSITPAGICNNATFNYGANSATAGTLITWERNVIAGISNAAATGGDTVSEVLTNTTDNPITVPYVFTLLANSCTNIQTVNVVVNPTPFLNTTLTPAAICDSSFFDYIPGSNTTGATFTWSRASVANITNPAANGTDNPNERLRNAASFPVVVTYVFTTTVNGCSNSENVVVSVNPRPRLSNTAPTPICDSTVFTFTPTSTTLGTTYTWSREFIGGIGALPATGGPGINELLKNNTNTNVTVPYVYTLSANGCSRTQTVSVLVHPTPKLSSSLVDSACSGVPFRYIPATNLTPAVTYAWSRAAVLNITPANGAGTGAVNETLTNTTAGTLDVVYVYTITVGASCSRTNNVAVRVRPSAEAPVIAIMPSATLCSGTQFQNFGAANMPATGVTYTWSADNAEVYATGTQNQNALVNFNNAGTATVTLTSTIGTTGCIGVANYTVNVGNGVSGVPQVIYASNKLICIQGNVTSYQWGYDDAATLDSVAFDGAINQSYFLTNALTATRNYWVMTTTEDGCMNKAYFNKPADNTPRIADNTDGNVQMNVFPNPAYNSVNVEVVTAVVGAMRIDVSNMLGQVVNTINSDVHNASINVATLPAGIYIVDCYIEGVKVGAAKFVKN